MKGMGDDPDGPASHLGVHCSGLILAEVDLPKAIEFSKIRLFF